MSISLLGGHLAGEGHVEAADGGDEAGEEEEEGQEEEEDEEGVATWGRQVAG